jgi:uncharacterized protein (DUF697 family)
MASLRNESLTLFKFLPGLRIQKNKEMNQQTLLSIYEKIEALISRLPGPLQKAILQELRPIKQTFLTQRPARLALLGEVNANASALVSALLGSELTLIGPQTDPGWINYEQRLKGGFRVLDARRLNQTSLSWSDLANALSKEDPDVALFLAGGTASTDLGFECEQATRVLDFLDQRFHKRVPLIGVIDLPADTGPAVVEKRRTELQAWLSGRSGLASHFVRAVAVSSFVRFRLDGSLDIERDERRNIRELADLITRELPDDAQVEMARLFGAKEVQKDLANRLIRAVTAMSAAIGAQPIPLADFPILTTLQFMMVAGVMHISGRELSLKAAGEFIGALGMNIGVGMAFREGARAAVKFLPGWGNAISGGVAAAGTYGIGRAAGAYFIEGISLAEVRKLFRRKKQSRVRQLGTEKKSQGDSSK